MRMLKRKFLRDSVETNSANMEETLGNRKGTKSKDAASDFQILLGQLASNSGMSENGTIDDSNSDYNIDINDLLNPTGFLVTAPVDSYYEDSASLYDSIFSDGVNLPVSVPLTTAQLQLTMDEEYAICDVSTLDTKSPNSNEKEFNSVGYVPGDYFDVMQKSPVFYEHNYSMRESELTKVKSNVDNDKNNKNAESDSSTCTKENGRKNVSVEISAQFGGGTIGYPGIFGTHPGQRSIFSPELASSPTATETTDNATVVESIPHKICFNEVWIDSDGKDISKANNDDDKDRASDDVSKSKDYHEISPMDIEDLADSASEAPSAEIPLPQQPQLQKFISKPPTSHMKECNNNKKDKNTPDDFVGIIGIVVTTKKSRKFTPLKVPFAVRSSPRFESQYSHIQEEKRSKIKTKDLQRPNQKGSYPQGSQKQNNERSKTTIRKSQRQRKAPVCYGYEWMFESDKVESSNKNQKINERTSIQNPIELRTGTKTKETVLRTSLRLIEQRLIMNKQTSKQSR